MDLAVQHDQQHHKFFILVDGKESVLQYRIIDNKTLDYYHTFVPSELRGKHIAENIVKYALDYARDNHYRVIPTCPYVKRIMDNNPQYQSLVAK